MRKLDELATQLAGLTDDEWQYIRGQVDSNKAYMRLLVPRTSDEQREFANAWNDRVEKAKED